HGSHALLSSMIPLGDQESGKSALTATLDDRSQSRCPWCGTPATPSALFTRRATRVLRKEKQAWQFRNGPSRTSSTTRARANAKRRRDDAKGRKKRTQTPPPKRGRENPSPPSNQINAPPPPPPRRNRKRKQ